MPNQFILENWTGDALFVSGARVLLACRDITKAERTADEIRKTTGNSDVDVYVLDLASLKSVRQCAGEIIKKEPKINILINNAGTCNYIVRQCFTIHFLSVYFVRLQKDDFISDGHMGCHKKTYMY